MKRLFSLFLLILLAGGFGPRWLSAAEGLAPLVRLLASSDDAAFQLDLLRGMSQAMEGRQQVPMPDGWEALEPRLAAASQAEIRSLARSLGLKFGSPAARQALRGLLANASAGVGERRDALAALLAIRDPELPGLLQARLGDATLRGEAIRALAAYNDPGTPNALLGGYGTFSAEEQRDAVNTLASRAAYARPLMTAVEAGQVPRQALTADLLRQLRSLNDPGINDALQCVWGTFRETSADRQQLIEKYKRVYFAGGSTPGDAPRGRAVFARVCQQCHVLFDTGGNVGPDLTGSNRGDLDYILQNMVDPNAVIPNEYRTSTLELKDDRVITGIVKQQDANALTVATANDVLVLPRSEIAAVYPSELSMMPEGLLDTLADQEVRDLIYYLRQPAQARLPEE